MDGRTNERTNKQTKTKKERKKERKTNGRTYIELFHPTALAANVCDRQTHATFALIYRIGLFMCFCNMNYSLLESFH